MRASAEPSDPVPLSSQGIKQQIFNNYAAALRIKTLFSPPSVITQIHSIKLRVEFRSYGVNRNGCGCRADVFNALMTQAAFYARNVPLNSNMIHHRTIIAIILNNVRALPLPISCVRREAARERGAESGLSSLFTSPPEIIHTDQVTGAGGAKVWLRRG